MLYQWFRLFRYDGAFADQSIANQDEAATVLADLDGTSSDWFYIGQYYPFNNFFAHMDVVNDQAANLVMQYWDGRSWRDVVDVLDGTKIGTATMGRSGVVQFSPDDQYGWIRIPDTSKNYAPTELQALKIYDLYWLRVRTSAALKNTTALKTMAYAFTTSNRLDNLDVEIGSYLASFATGKTNWIDEILTASLHMVYDLRGTGLIVHPGQILRFDDVSLACDYKTLILIYRQLGKAYDEKRRELEQQYDALLKAGRFTIDVNVDGRVQQSEIFNRVYTAVR